jgi:pantoate--beta-alanine ligase
VQDAVAKGERDADRAIAAGRAVLEADAIEPEYLAAVSAETLEPVKVISGEVLVPVAARIGGVRLIDNVIVGPGVRE